MTIPYLGHTDATLYFKRSSQVVVHNGLEESFVRSDIVAWCEQTGIRIVEFGFAGERVLLRFAAPEDAFAFKMRWNWAAP